MNPSGIQASAAELKQLTTVFGDRDAAIRQGLVAGGVRYEVVGNLKEDFIGSPA